MILFQYACCLLCSCMDIDLIDHLASLDNASDPARDHDNASDHGNAIQMPTEMVVAWMWMI